MHLFLVLIMMFQEKNVVLIFPGQEECFEYKVQCAEAKQRRECVKFLFTLCLVAHPERAGA